MKRRIKATLTSRRKYREINSVPTVTRPVRVERFVGGSFAQHEQTRLAEQGYVMQVDNLLRSGKMADQVPADETLKEIELCISRLKTSRMKAWSSRLRNWLTTIRK